MDMDKEGTLMLIQLYENQPLLWNPKHTWHFHKTKKMDAWQEIADRCNITVEEAKKKMSSLLGSFRREKKKGVRTIGTGKGATEIYKTDWYAFKHFSFLLDKDNPRRTINSEERIGISETETQYEDGEISFNNTTILYTSYLDDSSSLECTTRIKKPFTKPSRKSKQKFSDQEDPRIGMAFKMLQEAEKVEDATTTYTKYLAEKLKLFNSRMRSILMHKINTIIFEAEMNMYSASDKSSVTEFSGAHSPPFISWPPSEALVTGDYYKDNHNASSISISANQFAYTESLHSSRTTKEEEIRTLSP